ncbi:TlpA disulfide reductase family protein [Virgibacillus sp. 179-BFC.A HS]|uniref:TlpA disulfide reductase family protein n=1 Tax=Tigheibacillus jepli TaxID=3035914 RepID=A0ABU5CI66_9BACI|nr:TlpA disulfide reductase family protein [Virgibacillus sp. 179-BFC.A HS]MDY0406023.1 TlpA disulfide reductase family protein [Virgibacillus sp. 179-BFC.A HS]
MKLRDEMPQLEGATTWLNSKPMKKEDLMNHKPTFIHFWSVSCDICKKVMPKVNELRDAYKDELNIVAVHMPRSKEDMNLNHIKEIAREHGMTQPIFVDNQHKLTDAFANQYVPAYYLFDKDGKLRHFQSGESGMKILYKRVNRLLGIKRNK